MTAVARNIIENTKPLPHKVAATQPTPEEMKILRRCYVGDPDAFTELYYRFRPVVFRVVARMISTSADQEELVQEVFLQVFRSIRSFKGTAKFSTWIQRVTRNVVHQHIRRKKSRIQLVLETDRAVPLWDGFRGEKNHTTPEDLAIRQDRRVAVSRAMDSLSVKKKAAMVLYDFKGLPVKEIADIVGAPVLTIRTRIFYARKEFYDSLKTEPAFSDIPLTGLCCSN